MYKASARKESTVLSASCVQVSGLSGPAPEDMFQQTHTQVRIMRRGSCFDSIAELTGSEKEIHRVFFHKFVKVFVDELFHIYVCPPSSDESIAAIMRHYDLVGFTECIGSVDCVHIPWNRCPAGLLNMYTGIAV